MRTEAGNRETRVFTEDGIYEVAFLAETIKAKEFRFWVRQILKGLCKGELELIRKQLEEQQPKVEIYNEFISQDELFNFKQIGDLFGYGRNKLFEILRNESILSDNRFNWNLPYSQYERYFKVKIIPRRTNNGVEKICTTLCKTNAIPFIKRVLDKKKDLLQKQAN